jgi:DNA replication and repair protein RecF
VQKYVRVNGVARRTSELVGEINAVMFGAPDLDLVLGTPAVRRRYLDILISQIDRTYLMALQRYQRVLSQRNHLLKSMRASRAKPGELDFWDDELAAAGGRIMARRVETVLKISQEAAPVYRELSGGGAVLQIIYRPSVAIEREASAGESGRTVSEEDLVRSLKSSMELQRDRELAQGFTVSGPHRDDLQMLLDDMDAAMFASRGECRTAVLAMKLAEASFLKERRGQEPILLLDDVLSELDEARRSHVLERAGQYQQCFLTTTDVDQIDRRYLSRMRRYDVSGGRVTPAA